MDSASLPRRLPKSSTPLSHPLKNDRYRHLFLDPLHTLLSSDNHHSSNATICLHDISEAYHTLVRRIHQHCFSLDSSSVQLPALKAFTQEKANLAYIIRRDILRALEPPNLDSSSQPRSPKDHADSLFDIHERLRRAHTDEVTVCHGALKFVMEIFRSPANNTTLNEDELIGCLGDILRLLEESNLPSFKGPVTHALCWAIISTQKLPHTVLYTVETRIIRILKLYLPKLPPELVDDEETVIDCLQTIAHLLRYHSKTFHASTVELLPRLLPYLSSPSCQLRHHTAHIVTSFAHILLSAPSPSGSDYTPPCSHQIRTRISALTKQYFDRQSQRRDASFPKNLKLVFQFVLAPEAQATSPQGNSASWIFPVTSSLIIMFGHDIFSSKRSLTLVLSFLEAIAQQSAVLPRMVWKCLVHNFRTAVQKARGSGEEVPNEVKYALEVLTNAGIQDGVGVPVVGVLLGCDPFDFSSHTSNLYSHWALSSVLECLKIMLAHDDAHDDGVNLLHRLLSVIEREPTVRPSGESSPFREMVPPSLFDGSVLDGSDADTVALVSRGISVVEGSSRNYGVEDVRYLSEGEVEQFWEGFVDCWGTVVDACFKRKMSRKSERHRLPQSVVLSWQSLLFVRSHTLSKSQQHLAFTPDLAPWASSIITSFLAKPTNLGPEAGTAHRMLAAKLGLIYAGQLWTVMANSFAKTSLAPAAIPIMNVLMEQDFAYNGKVPEEFYILCKDIVMDCAEGIWPTAMARLNESETVQSGSLMAERITKRRRVWVVIAKLAGDLRVEKRLSWKETVELLYTPLGIWGLSSQDDEEKIWDIILKWTMEQAKLKGSVNSCTFLENLAERLQRDGRASKLPSTELGHMLDRLSLSSRTAAIPSSFLSLVTTFLCDSFYLSEDSFHDVAGVLKQMKRLILTAANELLVPLVVEVQGALSLWIGNERHPISPDDYNEILAPIYTTLLDRLSGLSEPPASLLSTINSLTPILTSAFNMSIPSPCVCPEAFADFFGNMFQRIGEPLDKWSPGLRRYASVFTQAWDGEWVDGMDVLKTQSQFTATGRSQDVNEGSDREGDQFTHQESGPRMEPPSPTSSLQSRSDEVIPDSEEDFRQVQDAPYSPDNRWAIGINPSQLSQSQPSFENSDSEGSLGIDANASYFDSVRPEFVQGASGDGTSQPSPRAESPELPDTFTSRARRNSVHSRPLLSASAAAAAPPKLDERKKRRSHDEPTTPRKRPKLVHSSRSVPVQRVTSPARVRPVRASSTMDRTPHSPDDANIAGVTEHDEERSHTGAHTNSGRMGRTESEGLSDDAGVNDGQLPAATARPDKGKGRQMDVEDEDEVNDDWETRVETPVIVRIANELSRQATRDTSSLIVPETRKNMSVQDATPQHRRVFNRRDTEQYARLRSVTEALYEPQPTQTHPNLVHSSTAPASLPTPSSSPFHAPPNASPADGAGGFKATPPRPEPPRRADTTPETIRSLREVHHKLVKEGRGVTLSEEDKAFVIDWSLGLLKEVTKKPGP